MILNLAVSTDSFPHLLAILRVMTEVVKMREKSGNLDPISDAVRLNDDYNSRYTYYLGDVRSKPEIRHPEGA